MRRVLPHGLASVLLFTMAAAECGEFVPDSSKVKHPAALGVLMDNSLDSKRTKQQMLDSVADMMKLSEDEALSLVSRDNGFGAVRCPRCSSYVREFTLHDLDHVYCSHCKAAYPSAEFPETHLHRGKNISGEPVEWKCYRKDGRGYQHFFSAVLRDARHHYLAEKTQDLARLYALTKDERYARRAAAILAALADAYPHWCARYDHHWYGRYIVSKRPWKGGVWGRGHWCEMPVSCVFAYDLIYDSPVWDALARERGSDARRPVEDWFRSSHKMIMEMHEDGGGKFGNLHPYTMRHVVAAGRTLNDLDMVHSVIPWFDGLTKGQFFFDGMWNEGTPDYHGQTVWNLDRAIRAVRGYTDPDGCVDKARGIKLVNADVKKDYPILEKASQVLRSTVYPDGRRVNIHDTHWSKAGGPICAAPNIELNGYGHFAMCRGDGEGLMQVHLHFCPLTSHGHYHRDRLSMLLWAAGTDVLPDIGYATDRRCYRYFATDCLSHNMAYAGWDTPRKPPEKAFALSELDTSIWARSSLLAYDPGTHCAKQIQLVEAESPGPEWQGIEMARRLIVMVAIDDRRSYVVDLFRLRGGDWHEWILRPSADEDCEQQCTLALKPRPGTLGGKDVAYGKFVKGAGYRCLIQKLQAGDSSRPCNVTWGGKQTGATVRAFLNGQPSTEIILARAPIIRPTRNLPSERDKHQGPYLMRRRSGGQGLTSCFGAVYDVWKASAKPSVDEVEWLAPQPGSELCVALRVRMGDREDLIYSSTDDIARTVAGVRVRGRVAALSRKRGKPAWGYVYGAGEIGAGDCRASSPPDVRAALQNVLRKADRGENALEVDAKLPEGTQLAGVWLRVIHGDGSAYGYRIERVEHTARGSRIVIHDEPGFERTDKGMRMLFFPNYEIPGAQRVEVCVPRFVAGHRSLDIGH